MSDLESRCLDAFPAWLRTLADDARAIASVLEWETLPEPTRRKLAAALNYLFKSLDLIPDGIEDLGFVDDAFVLRVAAAAAKECGGVEASQAVVRLAEEAALVAELLGDDHARLERYVAGLESIAARGRSVDDIVTDTSVRAALVSEVRSWADTYQAPTFARDEKNLVKLRSFLAKKLPA
ncbi:MAG: DUF1232 domain-containing protein [Polyangiaceae bacterium]|nr:DUF1232 domain-containing protein [Polyangiaceae bacterium]